MDLSWHIGDVVKKLREKRGLSQVELGTLAGLHKNTIARIEDGDEGVTGKTLKAVATALEITVAQMYGLIPSTEQEPQRVEPSSTTAGSLQRTGTTGDRRQINVGPPDGVPERRR